MSEREAPSGQLPRGSLLERVLPFVRELSLGGDELRERTVFAMTSAVGGPLLSLYGWQDFQAGHPLLGSVSLACGLTLLCGFFMVRQRRTRTMPRIAMALLVLVLCIGMYVPTDRTTMNWAAIIPMLLIFLFGLREGLAWTAGLFVAFMTSICLPGLFGGAPDIAQWPNGWRIVDFTVAFFVVVFCATGYDVLRLVANRETSARNLALEDALEARRRSEERLRDFTETASDWLFELDDQLHVTHISGNWETLTGASAQAVIGRSVLAPLTGWRLAGGEGLRGPLERREPFRDLEMEMVSDTDRRLHLSLRGHPLHDADGRFAGYRAVGTDITSRVEAERALSESNRALQQASKMEAVGQLTSGVAHDFNNLLTVIMGNLELVSMQLEDAGLSIEDLEQAITAADRAADLTGKLLAFSRRQSLQPASVDSGALIADTANLLVRTLPESIRVTRRELGSWACEVDRSQFENALLNLALNARDAMPDGGELELTVDDAPLDEDQAAVWSVAPGDYVRFAVRDTGSGISEAMVEHIFEPFFSTKAAGEGTGLGLSMVYGFVRQSGGGLRVSSVPGEGTTMEFVLPRSVSGVRVEAGPRRRPAALGNGREVLVIEDEAAVRNLVVSMLRRLGFTPRAAASGEEGVEMFKDAPPDLVISDVVLVGTMTGVDALNAIREIDPAVPALFMSGYSESVFRDRSDLPEDVELLPKPFGLADLEERLQALASMAPSAAR